MTTIQETCAKVEQCDRDAAADLVEWHNEAASAWHIQGGADLRFFAANMPDGVRRGIWDEHPFVQAFAQHRIRSLPLPDGWQDIASAPADGFFIVWSPDHPDCPMVVRGSILHGALERERAGKQPAHLRFGHFTHWTPLPPPPVERTKSTGETQ